MTLIVMILILALSCSKNNESQGINDDILENKVFKEITIENEILIEENSAKINQATTNWGEKIVNSLDGLNLRKEPNQNSEKITLIPNNSIVYLLKKDFKNETIDGINNRWYFIQYNEYLGWVFGGYLIDTEKDDYVEKLQYRMIFIEDENEKYVFDSVMIEINSNKNEIENYMIDNNTYFKLTRIEGENYILRHNFLPMKRINSEYEEINVQINKDTLEPFYVHLGEKGGGHTYVYLTLIDNRILVRLEHQQINWNMYDGDI